MDTTVPSYVTYMFLPPILQIFILSESNVPDSVSVAQWSSRPAQVARQSLEARIGLGCAGMGLGLGFIAPTREMED